MWLWADFRQLKCLLYLLQSQLLYRNMCKTNTYPGPTHPPEVRYIVTERAAQSAWDKELVTQVISPAPPCSAAHCDPELHLHLKSIEMTNVTPQHERSFPLSVKEERIRKKIKNQQREAPTNSGGFKACNYQLHRLWQDVEFVDMSFLHSSFVPSANFCAPRGRKLVDRAQV